MSILIDQNLCIGCKRCTEVCPGNLIKQLSLDGSKKTKANIKNPEYCWGCTSCIKVCPKKAIKFFLGADLGGRGSVLSYEKKDFISIWHVTHADGTCEEIEVNTKEANKY